MRHSVNYIPFLILVCLISCSSRKDVYLSLRDDVANAIMQYVSKDTVGHKIFAIVPTHNMVNNLKTQQQGYLIGPLYKRLLLELHREHMVLIWEENDQKVYLVTKYETILQGDNQIEPKYFAPQDSLIIGSYVSDSGTINYMKRAIYISFDPNNKIIINTRPDTIFCQL